MNKDWQQRTRLLLGDEKMERLGEAHILVAGLGGVGSWAAEMLCRSGIGEFTLVDADVVDITNINRQMPATTATINLLKTEVVAKRLREINPKVKLTLVSWYIDETNIPHLLDSNRFSYVIDAIDTLFSKSTLIRECWKRATPIVSSLGAGGKSDLSSIRVGDIWKSEHCRLGKSLRRMLRSEKGRHKLTVVYSNTPAKDNAVKLNPNGGKPIIGTVGYFTATFGCYLAQHIINEI